MVKAVKAKSGDYSVCMRVMRAREKLVDRVEERCFLDLVLKEGGGFVHLRDDLIYLFRDDLIYL